MEDLEATLDSDLIYLNRDCTGFLGSCVVKVDRNTGDSTLLFGGSPEAPVAGLSGLGASPSGDIWTSHGRVFGVSIITIDGETGEAQVAGDVVVLLDPPIGNTSNFDLLYTDIAVGNDGQVWVTGTGFVAGLFRTERVVFGGGLRPVVDADNNPFVIGNFSEVQVFNSVPEPTTILLLSLGLAGLGFSRRNVH